MPGVREAKLESLVEPTAAELGLSLVGIELRGPAGRQQLRVTVERQDGEGVTVADCASMSRELSVLLDAEDPIAGAYQLEVSSPGVERPLRRREDYERFAGSDAALYHRVDGTYRKLTGRLLGLSEDGRVRVETDDGITELGLTDIEKAHLVYHFGPGKRR